VMADCTCPLCFAERSSLSRERIMLVGIAFAASNAIVEPASMARHLCHPAQERLVAMAHVVIAAILEMSGASPLPH
jgi:hypothetical protein